MSKEIMTVDEVAELLSVKPKTIRQWVFQKKIPFFHLGRLLRFRLASILEWTAEMEEKKQEAATAPKQGKGKAKAKARTKK